MDSYVAACSGYDDLDLFICDRGVAYQKDMSRPVRYDESYFNKCASYEGKDIALKINEGRRALVDKWASPSRRVLDVGIGSGEFIKSRPNTFGYDINPKAEEWLRRQGLWAPSFRLFNAFTFWDVLEHVAEPACYFSQMYPYSFVFASLPIFTDLARIRQSRHYRPNEHFYYWTESGFIDWMKLYGFAHLETADYETKAGRDSILSFAFRCEC